MSFPVPPADHGSDRFDYIEIECDVSPQPALPEWLTADFMPCMDCRANLFLRWMSSEQRWHSTVAHDDGCPTLAAQI